jgi:hypothetical protein
MSDPVETLFTWMEKSNDVRNVDKQLQIDTLTAITELILDSVKVTTDVNPEKENDES